MVNIIYERLKNAPTKDTDNFTYADRTMIRKDWASMLPDMKPRPKTNYIIFKRIIGPLLFTVALNLDSRSIPYYKAESFVGILVKPDDCFFKLIGTSSFEMVHWFEHKQLYQEVATEIKQRSWLPVEGPLTLEDIFTAFKRAATERFIHEG